MFLGSSHKHEPLLFSKLPSILTLNFDLILWSFVTFLGPISYFWGWSKVQKCLLGLLIQLSSFYFLCCLEF